QGQWIEVLSKNVDVIRKDSAHSEKEESKDHSEQRTQENQAPRIQNPSLLEGYENEVHQALKMAGGAPTVILRTAEGKIIGQASVSDLNAWGFGSSEKPTMEQWGELPPPGLEPSPEPKDTFSTKIQSLRQSLPSFPSSASKSPPPRGAYKFDKAFLGGWKTDGW